MRVCLYDALSLFTIMPTHGQIAHLSVNVCMYFTMFKEVENFYRSALKMGYLPMHFYAQLNPILHFGHTHIHTCVDVQVEQYRNEIFTWLPKTFYTALHTMKIEWQWLVHRLDLPYY